MVGADGMVVPGFATPGRLCDIEPLVEGELMEPLPVVLLPDLSTLVSIFVPARRLRTWFVAASQHFKLFSDVLGPDCAAAGP